MSRSYSRRQAERAINSLRSELNRVLDEIEAQRRNPELSANHQAYLNDYAAVRMAGYLEQLCFHAISGRVGEATEGSVQSFINSWFYKSPNLGAKQFRDLFKRFGSAIDSRVVAYLDEGLNRDILNTLLETRNAVAHGKEYSGAGRQGLKTFRDLVDGIDDLVRQILLIPEATL